MARTLASTEQQLNSLLAKPLLQLGFRQAECLIFQREMPEIRQLLRFPTRSRSGEVRFNVNGAVRFERIERLLGNLDPLMPTFMMPVHWLRPSNDYVEWQFVAHSPGDLIDRVLTDCRLYVVPFLEAFSVIARLKGQLLYELEYFEGVAAQRDRTGPEVPQNDGRLKLVVSPEQRIEKLAAIYVLEGKQEAARGIIESELVKLRASMGSQRDIALRARWEKLKKVLLDPG